MLFLEETLNSDVSVTHPGDPAGDRRRFAWDAACHCHPYPSLLSHSLTKTGGTQERPPDIAGACRSCCRLRSATDRPADSSLLISSCSCRDLLLLLLPPLLTSYPAPYPTTGGAMPRFRSAERSADSERRRPRLRSRRPAPPAAARSSCAAPCCRVPDGSQASEEAGLLLGALMERRRATCGPPFSARCLLRRGGAG